MTPPYVDCGLLPSGNSDSAYTARAHIELYQEALLAVRIGLDTRLGVRMVAMTMTLPHQHNICVLCLHSHIYTLGLY